MKLSDKLFSGFLVGVLVISVFLGMPFSEAFGSENEELVLIKGVEGRAEVQNLQELGEVVDEYGEYMLLETSENRLQYLDEEYRVETLDNRNELNVKGHEFDTSDGYPDFSSELTKEGYEPGHRGLYIVDMIGPVNPEWRGDLEGMGIDIVNYQPNYAYEVSMTPEQAEEVEDMFFVDSVGIYQPGFKLADDVSPGLVSVSFSNGERIVTEVEDEDELITLANQNEVYYINQYQEPELHDEMATQIIGGGCWLYDNDSDPDTAYRVKGDYGSLANQMGYDGEGVVTAIADTGLGDGTTGNAGHPDFTGRVIGGHSYTSDGSWEDGHGHGTHCAGSVGGHTHGGTGQRVYEDYYSGQGSAPATEFFSVRIFDGSGSFVAPDDYHEIIEVAKQQGDAYVHSNSWGNTQNLGDYLASAAAYDAAVRDADRDAPGNQPMVITVANGNEGSGDNTVGAPATGKNVIGVAATENYNPAGGGGGRGALSVPSSSSEDSNPQEELLTTNPDNVVSFSSRGWTDDNRIKPDVAAPGQDIESTLPGGDYGTKQGTSMANPAVAGAASVIVDWYEDVYGERPSPAMVKALLINTAHDLDDANGNTDPIPNKEEGWGMVNLPGLIDAPASFALEDQTSLLQTGQTDEYEIEYQNEGEPLKITLTYTDKNATAGDDPALKNNLDLEVESPSGQTYVGNAFQNGWTPAGEGAMSDFDTDGDKYDDVNNVQNVYIHPDDLESGTYTVRVNGTNIPADANNDGNANQDYALVTYNTEANVGPAPPTDPSPSDGTSGVGTDPELSVYVEHGDGKSMNVSFHDASDDSTIDTKNGVSSGTRASVTWTGLGHDTNYGWYAVADDGAETATSDTWNFTTKPAGAPSIEVTSPEWDDSWYAGTEEEITWDTTEGDGNITNIDLEYTTDGGASWTDIDSGLNDTGSYLWTVANEPTKKAQIRATVHDDGGMSAKDISGEFAIIEPSPLPPSNPDPGDGSNGISTSPELSVYVKHEPGWKMDVKFYDASDDSLIGEETDVNSGSRASVNWSGLNYNTGYSWYVVVDDGEGTETSDEWSFTTHEAGDPLIEIKRPDWDDTFYINSEEDIIWNATAGDADITSVDLEYTIDDGGSWSNISTGLNDTGNYQWQVPDEPTEEARIRATVHDANDKATEDVSGLFNIEDLGPLPPTNPDPIGGATDIGVNPELSVYVEHEEGVSMNVSFYDASDDSLIGTDNDVANDSRASVPWNGLDYNSGYDWYAVAEDFRGTSVESGVWSFTTREAKPLAPSDPTPAEGDTDVETEPELSVYVEHEAGEPMDVSFYDASDDSLIGSENGVASGEYASTTWSGLELNSTYSWYAVADDGAQQLTSTEWSFTTVGYELTINLEGQGSTDPEAGTYVHAPDDQVTVTATPEEGWYFDEWTGDYGGGNEEITITMDGDKEITANFVIHEYDLTINIEGEGSTDPSEGTTTYEHGEQVTVTATSAEGWSFVEWTGDHQGSQEKITLTIEENMEITAHFEVDEYDLTINIEGEGSTDPSEGTTTYEYGEQVTVTATSAEGWSFVEWTGDHESSEEEITLTIEENMEITANFEINEYDLTINTEGEGSTTPSNGTHTYEYGEKVVVEASPAEDWYFAEWTGDHEGVAKVVELEMDEDKEITANFEEYEPASFEIEILEYKEDVKKGEKITVKYKVTNTGELEGTQDIVLYLDGEQVAEKTDLTLEGGEEYEGNFTIDADDVGEKDIEVSSGDSDDGAMVTVEEKSFLSNYWWLLPLLLLIGIIAVVAVIFVMRGEDEEEEEESVPPPPPSAGPGQTGDSPQEGEWVEEEEETDEFPKP